MDLSLEQPTLSAELMFGRPRELKIFVSSRMRGNALTAERREANATIDGLGNYRAWAWERNAAAGPYSSEKVCVRHAGTSDGLILIVGRDLSAITVKEYVTALDAGVPCYILVKDGVRRLSATKQFIKAERTNAAVTVAFGNLSELRTQITNALYTYASTLQRRDIVQRRNAGGRR